VRKRQDPFWVHTIPNQPIRENIAVEGSSVKGYEVVDFSKKPAEVRQLSCFIGLLPEEELMNRNPAVAGQL
jgi:hypothetical protein